MVDKIVNIFSSSMRKEVFKILGEIIFFEFIYVLTLFLLLYFIPHQSYETIYLLNINLHFLISFLIWRTINLSSVNRDILIILGIWFTISTIYSIFFIFSDPNFSEDFNFINYHIISVFTSTYQLFFTLYIFIISVFPQIKKRLVLTNALTLSIMISIINFTPIFISGQYIHSYEPLFSRSYVVHILNFCLLIIFWHQYTQSKLIFSEYLSSIISAYTILIGLQIFHMFSAENDLIFYYFAQYFNSILYIIIIFSLISRWIYLLNPSSKDNERYIENYYFLKGFINKPRRSYLIEFYSNFKKSHIIISLAVILFLGIYLFFFNKFEIFIRLNLLILILAAVITMILVILTWYNRWYNSIGFFFRKSVK